MQPVLINDKDKKKHLKTQTFGLLNCGHNYIICIKENT